MNSWQVYEFTVDDLLCSDGTLSICLDGWSFTDSRACLICSTLSDIIEIALILASLQRNGYYWQKGVMILRQIAWLFLWINIMPIVLWWCACLNNHIIRNLGLSAVCIIWQIIFDSPIVSGHLSPPPYYQLESILAYDLYFMTGHSLVNFMY